MSPLLALTSSPVEPSALAAAVLAEADRLSSSRGRCGAVATFAGTARGENLGRRVERLEYEAYEPLALRAFAQIVAEAADHWPGVTLGVHHRVGRVEVGEVSVAIAAASPHRDAAFRACRYAIERLKQVAPIWKHEFFEGGDAWIEGATADPGDARAREEALGRACA